MSRSIGDLELKDQGVIATPDIKQVQLDLINSLSLRQATHLIVQ
jgi:hypothetical protein